MHLFKAALTPPAPIPHGHTHELDYPVSTDCTYLSARLGIVWAFET